MGSHRLDREETVSNSSLALVLSVDKLIWTFEVLGMARLGVDTSALLPKTKSSPACWV
jgi:hypothetical protein